jgi:hypothetical protein
MKTTKTKSANASYSLDRDVLTRQLLRDDTCNWIIEAGVKKFNDGEILEKNMLLFLEYMKILNKNKK